MVVASAIPAGIDVIGSPTGVFRASVPVEWCRGASNHANFPPPSDQVHGRTQRPYFAKGNRVARAIGDVLD